MRRGRPKKQIISENEDGGIVRIAPSSLTPAEELQDGVLALYLAQNKKLNEIASAINDYSIRLAGEDKGFERWHKLSTTLKDLTEALEYLKNIVVKQYGIEKATQETLAGTNVLEDLLNKKREKK